MQPNIEENLIELIKQRDIISEKIGCILEPELDKVRKEHRGNGHHIEDIEISGENIILQIWYDDWETSRRCRHVIKVKDYE